MNFFDQKKNSSGLPFSSSVLQSVLQLSTDSLVRYVVDHFVTLTHLWRQNSTNGEPDSIDNICATIQQFTSDLPKKENVLNIYWSLLRSAWNNAPVCSMDLFLASFQS